MEPIFTRVMSWERHGLAFIPSPDKKIFLTLFFTIFSTVTGVGIVVPLLPVYAHDLGAPGIYIGLIFGSFSLSRTILLPFFGRLSDRHGRKPFIVTGLAGHVLVSTAFVLSSTISSLITIRFVQGMVSAMIMPVVQAYVGEITPKGKEGHSMGLFSMSMFASLSLGPLMGGVVMDLWSISGGFICMGILSGIGLILCICLLPPTSTEAVHGREEPVIPWRRLVRDAGIWGLFSYRFAYTACIGIIWCFLPIFAQTRFSLSGSTTGVLVMLAVFFSGILQLPMGYVADRASTRVMVVAGGVVCAVGMVLLFTAEGYAGLMAGVSVFGLGGGISMPAIMARMVIKGNDKGAMASVVSILTVAHSLGMMVGSMAAGAAMDFLELAFVFPCGAFLMVVGCIAFLVGVSFDRAASGSADGGRSC